MAAGMLIVLSGPSGVGKGTIIRRILSKETGITLSVSATTRKPRTGERDGVNYHFVSVEAFMEMLANGDLLEHAVVYDNYYGTPKRRVMELLEKGRDVMMEIDTVGAMNVKRMFPQAVTIFLLPPSPKALEERLRGRGTETEEIFRKRIAAATEELTKAPEYDYTVLNDDADACAAKVIEIIDNEKTKRAAV